jgi:hypothetical protein
MVISSYFFPGVLAISIWWNGVSIWIVVFPPLDQQGTGQRGLWWLEWESVLQRGY